MARITKKQKRNQEIANEIARVMMESRGRKCFTWKMSDHSVVDDGIRFHVNGNAFKGYVTITLTWLDYYAVELVEDGTGKKRYEDSIDYRALSDYTDSLIMSKGVA